MVAAVDSRGNSDRGEGAVAKQQCSAASDSRGGDGGDGARTVAAAEMAALAATAPGGVGD
jgi:hypothetical protein